MLLIEALYQDLHTPLAGDVYLISFYIAWVGNNFSSNKIMLAETPGLE